MKKTIALLLCAGLLLCACCVPEAPPEKVKVAVLAAMKMEARHLESRMDNARTVKIACNKFTRGQIGGAEVALCQSGMGLDKAEAGARALIENFQPDVLVLCGMSGGIVPEMGLYGTVIADAVYPTWTSDWIAVPTDKALVKRAAKVLGKDARVASISTGDKMTWRKSDYDKISKACGAVAVDQESYAVARAAQEAGVPLLIIRSMSDTYDNTSLLGFFQYGPISAETAAKCAVKVIEELT